MPQQDSRDRVVWLVEEGGNYSVKSAYEVLQKSTPSVYSLAMDSLWDIKALPNALALAWRILKGKVSTRMDLIRRGIILPSTMCPLCN